VPNAGDVVSPGCAPSGARWVRPERSPATRLTRTPVTARQRTPLPDRWTPAAGRSVRRREAATGAHRLRGVLGERRLLAHQEAGATRAVDQAQVAAAVAQAVGERGRVGHGRARSWPGRVGDGSPI
jgi:hypothetical protein